MPGVDVDLSARHPDAGRERGRAVHVDVRLCGFGLRRGPLRDPFQPPQHGCFWLQYQRCPLLCERRNLYFLHHNGRPNKQLPVRGRMGW